jgi:hypothetical protein
MARICKMDGDADVKHDGDKHHGFPEGFQDGFQDDFQDGFQDDFQDDFNNDEDRGDGVQVHSLPEGDLQVEISGAVAVADGAGATHEQGEVRVAAVHGGEAHTAPQDKGGGNLEHGLLGADVRVEVQGAGENIIIGGAVEVYKPTQEDQLPMRLTEEVEKGIPELKYDMEHELRVYHEFRHSL